MANGHTETEKADLASAGLWRSFLEVAVLWSIKGQAEKHSPFLPRVYTFLCNVMVDTA